MDRIWGKREKGKKGKLYYGILFASIAGQSRLRGFPVERHSVDRNGAPVIRGEDVVTVYGHCPSRVGLDTHGIASPGEVYWNLTPAELYEHAISAREGSVAANGAFTSTTGRHTGRSPGDKFLVEENCTKYDI